MEIAVVFVIYNRALDDSETAQALQCLSDAPERIVVYDNSEREFGNRQRCDELGWRYLGCGKNVGLPQAYNVCIDALKAEEFGGVVTIFDDDTHISSDYFSVLRQAASAQSAHLFFPILLAGEKIVSPQVIHPNQHAEFYASKEACLTSDGTDRFAFNSGMAVRMSVFQRLRYDERLFLDGVDYAFLRDCYRLGMTAEVLPVTMEHGFSGAQRLDYASALARFRHYAADFSVVLASNPKGYRYLVGKRALHLALIYKKFTFLRVFRHPGR